jgi:hypothetical protein
MFFNILKFYLLLLLYSPCPILFTTYFNSAVYISESWLSGAKQVEQVLLLAEIRNWEEKEEEKEIYHK